MKIESVMKRFLEFSGMSVAEGEKYRGLCAEATAQLEGRRNSVPGGESLLEAGAAAMAYHRYILLALAAGGSLTIGRPGDGPDGALRGAAALKEEYLAAAADYLTPEGFLFRQTEVGV